MKAEIHADVKLLFTPLAARLTRIYPLCPICLLTPDLDQAHPSRPDSYPVSCRHFRGKGETYWQMRWIGSFSGQVRIHRRPDGNRGQHRWHS